MSESIDGKFAAAAGCMDGRTWPAIQEFAREELGAANVDVVAAEAGFVKAASRRVSERMLKRLEISRQYHGATDVIVFGHESCAGNPVENALHENQTIQAARRLQQALPEMNIHPVFVERRMLNDGLKWKVRRLTNDKQEVESDSQVIPFI